ncbi:hypothetical protein [Rickettsia endosymbiont of Halotydeus destructor]|uniref:hypothetical protein n=1 Tax=Rickettsia endosymbiont of Halotydeus destructor TaxID=2996754 RepID=UPI003BB1CFED
MGKNIDIEEMRKRLTEQKSKHSSNKQEFSENANDVKERQEKKGTNLDKATGKKKTSKGCSIL